MFIYAHNRDSQTARFTMLFHGPENSKTAPPVGDPGHLYNKSGQAHLRPLPKWHHDQLNHFSRAHSCVHQTNTQTGKPCNTGYNRSYLALTPSPPMRPKMQNKTRTGREILFKLFAGHIAELLQEDCSDEAVRCEVTFLGLDHRPN